jgi:hypothetical protein
MARGFEIQNNLPARFLPFSEPVREWLKSLDIEDRKVISEAIKDVEFS